MAYDQSKDRLVKSYGNIELNANTTLEVGVWQYNGADPKVRVTKVTKGKEGNLYREAIVKTTVSEWDAIVNLIKENTDGQR